MKVISGVSVNILLLSLSFFLRLGPRAGIVNRLGDFQVAPHLPHQPLRLYENDVASGKKPFQTFRKSLET
jgi:hypothetical protein